MKKRVSNDDIILSSKLRALRISKGLTMQDIAVILGVTSQQIQKYEKGINRLPVVSMFKLCEEFNISPLYFQNVKVDNENTELIPEMDNDSIKLNQYFNKIGDTLLKKQLLQLLKIFTSYTPYSSSKL